MKKFKQYYRVFFQIASLIVIALLFWAVIKNPGLWWLFLIFLPFIAAGWYDVLQQKDNVRRNYPIIGTFKSLYVNERHVIVQEFIENSIEGSPFNWVQRDIVNIRSDNNLLTLAFGTELDINSAGYDFWLHSMQPLPVQKDDLRISIGNNQCIKPYNASILNVSAMSFGSISKNAVLAMGEGARLGGFALNTGEGGLADCHLSPGCDLIFQFGTGYFGCRTKDGRFDPEKFQKIAIRPEVKMIEIKISQGAKPGYGAVLPASKNTREIAALRGVEPHTLIHSPGSHSAFSNPFELLEFINQLRELSGGKPIGFKICIGIQHEFIALCKAMLAKGIKPDFIVVDGSEGGTNAAHIESLHYVGTPIEIALPFVNNALVGFNLKKDITIIGCGKIITSFDVIRFLALGADAVYSARAMMFAVGCTQALKCNTNECPTGVTTMNPVLVKGLVVKEKKFRVANFHNNTIQGVKEMLAAAGIKDFKEIIRSNIYRRVDHAKTMSLEEIYPGLKTGDLLKEPYPEQFEELMRKAEINFKEN
ncbi:MAG: FMN-binding glutamate synthase family protein [Bacteroidetes bacterium]|nr:FMN-binding glutamate synthase family protein [Bacteroidota bacterium]